MDVLFVLLHVALIWMLAAVTPGANVLLTINTALHYDCKLAMYSAFGVSTATLFWAFFGGSGLVILFTYFPQLLTGMKVIGGCYLLYLGIRQIYLTRKYNRLNALGDAHPLPVITRKKVFILAFITSILNPKTGFFVVSLFSVSMPKQMGLEMIAAIMITMACITLCWHLFLSVAFSHHAAKRVYARLSGAIDYITGGLFTVFGVKVMVS